MLIPVSVAFLFVLPLGAMLLRYGPRWISLMMGIAVGLLLASTFVTSSTAASHIMVQQVHALAEGGRLSALAVLFTCLGMLFHISKGLGGNPKSPLQTVALWGLYLALLVSATVPPTLLMLVKKGEGPLEPKAIFQIAGLITTGTAIATLLAATTLIALFFRVIVRYFRG